MIIIYTDGSTLGNGKENSYGGWAYLINNNEVKNGSEKNTTNQRMELTAAIKALNNFENIEEEITVYSDSSYLVNCYIQKWYVNWLNNNWRNSKRQPVANQDLWEQLIPYFENPLINFSKVKGHNGIRENEIVDAAAVNAAENLKFSENYGI